MFADVQVNNPMGIGDRFYAAILRQFDPTNGRFWKLEYELPVGLPGTTIGVSGQRNPFDVGSDLAAADLSGESEIFRIVRAPFTDSIAPEERLRRPHLAAQQRGHQLFLGRYSSVCRRCVCR